MRPYAEAKRGVHPRDVAIYHRTNLPELQDKKWVWDLRGREALYLGCYDFSGKRVLEFGAANGGLTFWMEQQGAEVVGVDLSPDIARTSWDVLVGPEDNIAEMNRVMSNGIERLNNGFWYGHEKLGSQAKLLHATAYELPDGIGRFDVVTLCAILLHLRDPMGALENAISFTEKAIIINDAVPHFIPKEVQHLPLAYFMPDKSRRRPHGGWTWWHITPEVYLHYLALKGFNVISNKTSFYEHASGTRELFTIVAERASTTNRTPGTR
jgi:SAM-dependent methyltransferase